ncbi:hypothetical protein FOZG_17672 [Fusarium oxysporum Fo47]|uniref:Uncharacterized protein n=1 Tax=Fusarium oxysporum Fo47 TaxID=660027 RepID=W9J9E1_FUSOX|nr:hypothetical protein FOZG_17672 [Fusarium oxysporum Fo47]
MAEAIQSLEQEFCKRNEIMKARFQPEFTTLYDRITEEVARTTALMTQELSQVREQLTQLCSRLERIRLQLDTVTRAHAT